MLPWQPWLVAVRDGASSLVVAWPYRFANLSLVRGFPRMELFNRLRRVSEDGSWRPTLQVQALASSAAEAPLICSEESETRCPTAKGRSWDLVDVRSKRVDALYCATSFSKYHD